MKKIIEACKLFLWARGLRKKAKKKEMREMPSYEERWVLFNLSRSQDSGPVFM